MEMRPKNAGIGDLPLQFYEPLDWLIVRSPALPFSATLGLEDVTNLVASKRVQRALAVGAPNLARAMERDGLSDRRVVARLLRYLRRMATRPTPFGLFAGVGVAHWGSQTTLMLAPLRGHTRPSMELLTALAANLANEPNVVCQTSVVANPANIMRAGRVFIWGRQGDERGEHSIRYTPPVALVLEAASARISFFDLKALLESKFRAAPEKAERLLLTLIRMNLLLTDLKPPQTVPDQAQYLLSKLSQLEGSLPQYVLLERLIDDCRRFDELSETDGREFANLLVRARQLSPRVEGIPLQVDAVLPPSAQTMNARLGAQAARIADVLLRLSPLPRGPGWLRRVRETFIERHGISQDVPIEQFLTEISIEDFLDEPPVAPHPRDAILLRLAATSLQMESDQIVLDDAWLEQLQTWTPSAETAPISLEVAISIKAASVEDVDAGKGTIVVAPIVGSRQAGRMAGRFASIIDLEPKLREICQLEQDRYLHDAVFAEIVYDPTSSKMANVVGRPAIRGYEITINAPSSLPPEQTIKLKDLLLGIRNDRLALFWSRDGRQIVPCAGHMLNSLDAPPIVRLLSELPFDGSPVLSVFNWGPAESVSKTPPCRMEERDTAGGTMERKARTQ